MYAIKIFHGYLTKDGRRSLDKQEAKLYAKKDSAEKIADVLGGRVKKIEITA